MSDFFKHTFLCFFLFRCKIGINGGTTLETSNSGFGSAVIFSCYNVCTPSQTEMLRLYVGDRIALYIQYIPVYPVYITSVAPYFTIRFLEGTNPLPNGFHTQLQNHLIVSDNGVSIVTGWNTLTEGQQFYHQSSGDGDEYLITEPGIYLTTVNIFIYNFKGLFQVMLKLMANKDMQLTHSTTHYSQHNQQYTVSVTGLIRMDQSNKFSIAVYSDVDKSFVVGEKSTRSLILIGSQDKVVGFSATLREQISRTFKDFWSEIDGWVTWVAGKNVFFENGFGFENKKSYVIQETGFFFISVNLVCKNGETSPVVIEIAVKYNEILNVTKGFSDRRQLEGGNKGYVTLQVNGGMHLSRWDILQPYFKVQSTSHNIIFEEVSTFSIVKIGMNYYFKFE